MSSSRVSYRTLAFQIATIVAIAGELSQAHAASVAGQGTWESTLLGRDLDGNTETVEAFYDTALNITWLADANYAKTSGYDADGRMTWDNAQTWAANLVYGGFTNWRQPLVKHNLNSEGVWYASNAVSDRELPHLDQVTFGNSRNCPPASGVPVCTLSGERNTGLFSNAQLDNYWGGTIYPAYNIIVEDLGSGYSVPYAIANNPLEFFALAVHPGDIGLAVPEPSTYHLMGLGFVMVLLASRRLK